MKMAEEVFIHVDMAEKRPELPEYDQDAPCPHCGGKTVTGFGLGGGGFGPYTYCEACEKIVSKSTYDE
jgi:hypothetical protein